MDTSLVERARDGDLAAFEMLVEERMAAVYRLSLAIVTDEADARDVVQETFVAPTARRRSVRSVVRKARGEPGADAAAGKEAASSP